MASLFSLFGPTQRLLAASMRLRAARHEVLTGNVANADTPGYRPRDVDFAGLLGALVPGGSEGQVELATTHPRHQGVAQWLFLADGVQAEPRIDENRVDLDREMAEVIENSLQHEAALTLLSRKLAGLRYAIEEGRR